MREIFEAFRQLRHEFGGLFTLTYGRDAFKSVRLEWDGEVQGVEAHWVQLVDETKLANCPTSVILEEFAHSIRMIASVPA